MRRAATLVAMILATWPACRREVGEKPVLAEPTSVEALPATLLRPDGRPKVLMLYAVACPRSRRLFDSWLELAARHHPRVAFHSVSIDTTQARAASPAGGHPVEFDNHGLPPETATRLGEALRPLGFSLGPFWSLPTVAVLDRQGRLVEAREGTDSAGWIQDAIALAERR